jgi:CRP-like cAMP-binding protein
MADLSCNLKDCFLCRFRMPEWKEVIAQNKKTIQFKKGREIFAEGEKVKGIYFIYSGSVKIHKQWIEPKELIIRFAKTGDILGHRGFGSGDIYPIGATALEDTKACFINNNFFETILKTNQSLTYKLMQFYAMELQKAEKRMRNLVHMEVKGRIATALLEINDFFGINNEKYISITISRQDIASYAGTTYETVFKFFNELISAKIISTSGKNIKLNNKDKLKKFIVNET